MNEIATPGLAHVTDVEADVTAPIDVGDTPRGRRRIVPIVGGRVFGPRLSGRILPGGADFQYWQADAVTELHARYVIETEDGARLYVENTGLRRGPPEAMARLARGEAVEPDLIYCRSVVRIETAAPAFLWLTRSIILCSAVRFPDRVLVRYFEVN